MTEADSDSPAETSADDTQTWMFPYTSEARTVRLHLTYISRRTLNALNLLWPEPDNLRAAQRSASHMTGLSNGAIHISADGYCLLPIFSRSSFRKL